LKKKYSWPFWVMKHVWSSYLIKIWYNYWHHIKLTSAFIKMVYTFKDEYINNICIVFGVDPVRKCRAPFGWIWLRRWSRFQFTRHATYIISLRLNDNLSKLCNFHHSSIFNLVRLVVYSLSIYLIFIIINFFWNSYF
jgi:hypothetical protein